MSGLTLNCLRHYLQRRAPKSVEVCALLVKEGEQLGWEWTSATSRIPHSGFLRRLYVLDVAERYRNLPGVHLYVGSDGEQ